MTQWFALSGNGDIVSVGEFDTFDDAEESLKHSPVWLVPEEVARDWLISLLIFNNQYKWGIA